jgi:hypothetical protein
MRGMKWITKMVMEMVLVLTVVLMETSGGGMEEPSGGDPAAFPPSNLLRRQPSDSLFRGFVFLRRLLAKLLGGLFL